MREEFRAYTSQRGRPLMENRIQACRRRWHKSCIAGPKSHAIWYIGLMCHLTCW